MSGSRFNLYLYLTKEPTEYSAYIPKFGVLFRGKTRYLALNRLFEYVFSREPKFNLSELTVVCMDETKARASFQQGLVEMVSVEIHNHIDQVVLASLFAAP